MMTSFGATLLERDPESKGPRRRRRALGIGANIGAEPRVRTGDLRLGNSEGPHSQTFPALRTCCNQDAMTPRKTLGVQDGPAFRCSDPSGNLWFIIDSKYSS